MSNCSGSSCLHIPLTEGDIPPGLPNILPNTGEYAIFKIDSHFLCVSSRLPHARRMTVRISTYVDVSLIAAYECNAVLHQVITSTRYERIIFIIFLICDMV